MNGSPISPFPYRLPDNSVHHHFAKQQPIKWDYTAKTAGFLAYKSAFSSLLHEHVDNVINGRKQLSSIPSLVMACGVCTSTLWEIKPVSDPHQVLAHSHPGAAWMATR